MRDPFATALAALFRAPGSVAAVYTTLEGYTIAVRAIINQPDQETPFGASRIVQGTYAVELQRSEVGDPESGATLQTASLSLVLRGAARLDAEGLTWICGAELA